MMILRSEILKEHSKRQTLFIVNYIGDDPVKFKELVRLFLSGEYRVTQRAAWVLSDCIEAHPKFLSSCLKALILNLEKENLHDAVKRNTLRVLQNASIPEELQGRLYNICMQYLYSDEAIAIQVFAMTVVANIVKQHPDLAVELKTLIESRLEESSAGFKARARKVLKQLKKYAS